MSGVQLGREQIRTRDTLRCNGDFASSKYESSDSAERYRTGDNRQQGQRIPSRRLRQDRQIFHYGAGSADSGWKTQNNAEEEEEERGNWPEAIHPA